MRKFARRAAIPAALVLALFGCSQKGTDGAKLPAGQKLHITKAVWAEYSSCPGGTTAISDILDACRRDKVECLIFARNEDIQVPYEIDD